MQQNKICQRSKKYLWENNLATAPSTYGIKKRDFYTSIGRNKKSWLAYNHGLTERRDIEEEKNLKYLKTCLREHQTD